MAHACGFCTVPTGPVATLGSSGTALQEGRCDELLAGSDPDTALSEAGRNSGGLIRPSACGALHFSRPLRPWVMRRGGTASLFPSRGRERKQPALFRLTRSARSTGATVVADAETTFWPKCWSASPRTLVLACSIEATAPLSARPKQKGQAHRTCPFQTERERAPYLGASTMTIWRPSERGWLSTLAISSVCSRTLSSSCMPSS